MSSKPLDRATMKELIDLLLPLCASPNQRRALFTMAFGLHPVLNGLNYEDDTLTFIPNALAHLHDYGEVEEGKTALGVVLEEVRGRVGLDKQKRIDTLLDKLSASQPEYSYGAHSYGPERDRPLLLFLDRPSGRQVVLEKQSVLVGRGDECDVIVNERQVSRQHVRIYQEAENFYIQDLNSRNGTWINGQQLKGDAQPLEDGDEINLAMAIRCQFVGSSTTAPVPFEQPNPGTARLRLDPETRRVFVNNIEVEPPLSLPQYRLLEVLYVKHGSICTRDQIIDCVWPDVMSENVSEQALGGLVRRVRDRLAEFDPDWQYIITVRGHGFRLNDSFAPD